MSEHRLDDAHDEGSARLGRFYCRACADEGRVRYGCERYSMGVYAMMACDAHWAASGFRDVGAEAPDPAYAGERLEPNDP